MLLKVSLPNHSLFLSSYLLITCSERYVAMDQYHHKIEFISLIVFILVEEALYFNMITKSSVVNTLVMVHLS